MKISNTIFIFLLFVIFDACVAPPDISVVPEIHFQELALYQRALKPDSLVITITFKDGDGDLGFDANDPKYNSYPYNKKIYFIANNGTITPVSTDLLEEGNVGVLDIPAELNCSTCKLVTWKTYNDPQYDELPVYSPDDCYQYQYETQLKLQEENLGLAAGISGSNNGIPNPNTLRDTSFDARVYNVKDTFYYKINPGYYNFDVDFLIAAGGTDYELFDWSKEVSCGNSLSGRFPVLSEEGGPVEGTLSYSVIATGLVDIIGELSNIKLRVSIRDRALHTSNTITTLNDFTFNSIRKN